MKSKFRIAITAAIIMFSANRLSAQGGMAYVSRDSIIKSVPGYLEKTKQIEETARSYNEELKTKRDDLNKRVALLLQPYGVRQNENEKEIRARMGPKDTIALGMLQQEDKLIAGTEKLYSTKIKNAYEQEIKPVDERIVVTIRRYALKYKLDMVFFIEDISPALAYINTKRSLTKDIIKELAAAK